MAIRPALIALMLLAACDAEIYHGLDERRANEVVVALREGGIPAEKRLEGRERPQAFTVVAPRSDEDQALRLLAARGLPRPGAPAPAARGLLPSPQELRRAQAQELEQQLAATLEALPLVQEARVHLVLPDDDPLSPVPVRAPRPTAAVLLRLRPPRTAAEGAAQAVTAARVAELVARATPGLEPSAVAVVQAPADTGPAPGAAPPLVHVGPLWVAASSQRTASGLLALCLLLGAGLFFSLGWRRLRRTP